MKTRQGKRRLGIAGVVAAAVVVVAGVVIPASAANAYTYTYRYGDANCSAKYHPTLQSENAGAGVHEISPGVGYYTWSFNTGSTVALHASVEGENSSTWATIGLNDKPYTYSYSCTNLPGGSGT